MCGFYGVARAKQDILKIFLRIHITAPFTRSAPWQLHWQAGMIPPEKDFYFIGGIRFWITHYS
jgi:hypothetical protein